MKNAWFYVTCGLKYCKVCQGRLAHSRLSQNHDALVQQNLRKVGLELTESSDVAKYLIRSEAVPITRSREYAVYKVRRTVCRNQCIQIGFNFFLLHLKCLTIRARVAWYSSYR